MLSAKRIIAIIVCFLISSSFIAKTVEPSDYKEIYMSGITTSVPRTITYQGILKDSLGNPVPEDTYNVIFRIFNDPVAGDSLWGETVTIYADSSGYFKKDLTNLNLPFDEEYWLELEIDLELLSPRQKINMTAYAARADTADYALNIPDDSFRWSVSGSVLYTNGFWGITRGGAGNILYGDGTNTMINLGVVCTTGHSSFDYTYTTIGGGLRNSAVGYYTTVCGGRDNHSGGNESVIAGGKSNIINGQSGAIGGGANNTIEDVYSAIGGGANNTAEGEYSTIGGGISNTTYEGYCAIGGGSTNGTAGLASTIGGGVINYVGGDFSAVLGGYADTIDTGADYSYLFGINSNLTQDSTFLVDMPHIHFGDESTGYEFPSEDGISGQVMATDGNGQLNWVSLTAAFKSEIQALLDNIEKLKRDNAVLARRIEELEKK